MTKGPLDVIAALDGAERQGELAKNDPRGGMRTLRELGVFVAPGQAWDKRHWIPGDHYLSGNEDAWQAEALRLRDAQLAQEKQYRADEAEKNSAHSSGIIPPTKIRRS